MVHGRQRQRKGYAKLVSACKQAQRDGLSHVWIDTCCIDKSSSAALSEAITSMFAYYARAKVCYALLDDIVVESSDRRDLQEILARSAWWTRGWTLQELIAPQVVKFLDGAWTFMGLKTDDALSSIIESITGIDSVVLEIPSTVRLVSIARRMSWAARRKTTRVEDRAYCLMGLFGVYMSPLYGEGNYAFIRLQEAIMRISNDHTIFAWTSLPQALLVQGFEHVSTMLALSPDQFKDSGNFRPLPYSTCATSPNIGTPKLDYAVTNAGLSICLPVQKIVQVEGLYTALLACTEGNESIPTAILLRATPLTPQGHFWRTTINETPIERSGQPWSPTGERGASGAVGLYILPRFTSLTTENIEPPWAAAHIDQTKTQSNLVRVSWLDKPLVALDLHALEIMNQRSNLALRGLLSLRTAYQLISTNRSHQLVQLRRPVSLNLRRTRNSRFVGRADILEELTRILLSRRNDEGDLTLPSGCVLSGMGGVGKTEVSVEFGYACLKNRLVRTVLWVDACNPWSIHRSFQRIAAELCLGEQLSGTEASSAVLGYLSELSEYGSVLQDLDTGPPRWLLIFDNVEYPSELAGFCPLQGSGCILINSRDPTTSYITGLDNIRLEPFTDSEAMDFLVKTTGLRELHLEDEQEKGAMHEIVNVCGGHPLALDQIVSIIVRRQLTFKEYIQWYMGQESSVAYHNIIRCHPQQSMALATLLDDALSSISPHSSELLKSLSFLDSDMIPESLLMHSAWSGTEDANMKRTAYFESRGELLRASLIRRDPRMNFLSIHRVVQNAVVARLNKSDFGESLCRAITQVDEAWNDAKTSNLDQGLGKVRSELWPHVLKLYTTAAETDIEDATKIVLQAIWEDFATEREDPGT